MIPYLLHHLLIHSATRWPDRVAVTDSARSLTYRALDELSNRLAHLLLSLGIAKGDRVGIDLEKSVDAVAAIFGILKAGAAYVPIDPKAPPRRAAFIVDNCRMGGLVTTRERFDRLQLPPASTPRCVILMDRQTPSEDGGSAEMADGPSDVPPDPGLIESDLAYILYTSGSTGEPKGVMISHRAALSFVNWAVDYFRLQPDDRLSNHAPLHFDLSVFDLFGAVAAGATVALVPPSAAVFPRNLADWIERSQITVWYSVPSALTQLVLYGGLERYRFPRLRLVLFAGEVFAVSHLRRLMTQVPGCAYYNLYGPTETNVCTVYPVSTPPAVEDGPVPIGRACANTEVFALNEAGEPIAPGETGELYVRGPTLMAGYWGRPEHTRAVLVPHPLQRDRLEFVYRTGDLVRLDRAGDFHFVGRRDSQVKSRGYRIELGDIEAVLHRHPAVAEAAVVTLPHQEFGCTLCAVVAVRDGHALDRSELAAFCGEYLPGYMIPSDFRFLAALPRTSNGKVDRAALQRGEAGGDICIKGVPGQPSI